MKLQAKRMILERVNNSWRSKKIILSVWTIIINLMSLVSLVGYLTVDLQISYQHSILSTFQNYQVYISPKVSQWAQTLWNNFYPRLHLLWVNITYFQNHYKKDLNMMGLRQDRKLIQLNQMKFILMTSDPFGHSIPPI